MHHSNNGDGMSPRRKRLIKLSILAFTLLIVIVVVVVVATTVGGSNDESSNNESSKEASNTLAVAAEESSQIPSMEPSVSLVCLYTCGFYWVRGVAQIRHTTPLLCIYNM